MLVRKHAPLTPQLLGPGMIARLQLRHANFKVSSGKVVQPRKLCAMLTVASQPALLIPIATTEKPRFASNKDYGKGSGIFTLLPLHGSQGLINWLVLSILVFKG